MHIKFLGPAKSLTEKLYRSRQATAKSFKVVPRSPDSSANSIQYLREDVKATLNLIIRIKVGTLTRRRSNYISTGFEF